ncbi:ankyrin repeat-containing domain protein [Bisporella sp. PMI_857]|nr:ankyrin repeat-containing domain protein [Bisporella sp. PMI_857]
MQAPTLIPRADNTVTRYGLLHMGDTKKFALQAASSGGREDIIQMQLETGADVDATDDYGRTSLLCAIRKRHEVVVKLLLAVETSIVNASNINSLTALSLAAKQSNAAIVDLLLRKRADFTIPDLNSTTCIK